MSERRRRIVPAEDAAGLAAWTLPAVIGTVLNRRRDSDSGHPPSAAEGYEQGFARGRAEGHTNGHAEGLAAGLEAGRAQGRGEFEAATTAADVNAARLGEAFDLLARPLEALDSEIERELVTLTLAVAKQLVRRELRTDPAQIIAIVRETVALLPAAARDVRVHLHPEDATVLRERLKTPSADRVWTLMEDPVLARGGCRVTTDTASIDARLESRIATIAATLFGEERALEREEPGKLAANPTATTTP